MKARPVDNLTNDKVKLIRYGIFQEALKKALFSKNIKDKHQARVIFSAIQEALNNTPAHAGVARWEPENKRPKSYKWICSECKKVAYYPHGSGKPKSIAYIFCPNCGCLMEDD